MNLCNHQLYLYYSSLYTLSCPVLLLLNHKPLLLKEVYKPLITWCFIPCGTHRYIYRYLCLMENIVAKLGCFSKLLMRFRISGSPSHFLHGSLFERLQQKNHSDYLKTSYYAQVSWLSQMLGSFLTEMWNMSNHYGARLTWNFASHQF